MPGTVDFSDGPSIKRLGQFAQENLKVAQTPPVWHSDPCDKGIPSWREATVPSLIEVGGRRRQLDHPWAPAAQRASTRNVGTRRRAFAVAAADKWKRAALPTCWHHGSVAPLARGHKKCASMRTRGRR
jgi:hypothetical protein